MSKIMHIQEKIKKFTQINPSERGIADPDYKVYLAQCSKLFELDSRLDHILCMDLEPEEEEVLVNEIEKETNEILITRLPV